MSDSGTPEDIGPVNDNNAEVSKTGDADIEDERLNATQKPDVEANTADSQSKTVEDNEDAETVDDNVTAGQSKPGNERTAVEAVADESKSEDTENVEDEVAAEPDHEPTVDNDNVSNEPEITSTSVLATKNKDQDVDHDHSHKTTGKDTAEFSSPPDQASQIGNGSICISFPLLVNTYTCMCADPVNSEIEGEGEVRMHMFR